MDGIPFTYKRDFMQLFVAYAQTQKGIVLIVNIL